MNGLSVHSLTKRWTRAGRPVVDAVSFTVERGEVVYLLGPNGSGKSTLLRMLSGQLTPDDGDVRVDGESVLQLSPIRLASLVAYVAQDHEASTSSDQTVLEHLLLAQDFAGKQVSWLFPKWRSRHLVMDRLRYLNVPLVARVDNLARTLSGGERQCLSLLIGSMQRPRLLLLDEPTRELDARARSDMERLFRHLIEEYRPGTLVVTHEYDEALRQADRIFLMRSGRIVAGLERDGPGWSIPSIKKALWDGAA